MKTNINTVIISALIALGNTSANADILNIGVLDFVNLRVGGRSQPAAVPVYAVPVTAAPAAVSSTATALASPAQPVVSSTAAALASAAPSSAPAPATAAPTAPAPAAPQATPAAPAPAPAQTYNYPPQQNWAPAQPVALVPATTAYAPVTYAPVAAVPQQLYIPVVAAPLYNNGGSGYFGGIFNGVGSVARGVGQTLDAAVPSVNLGIGQRNNAPAPSPVYYYPVNSKGGREGYVG